MRRQDPWAVQLRLDGDRETVPRRASAKRRPAQAGQLAMDAITGGFAVETPEDTQADTDRLCDVPRDVAGQEDPPAEDAEILAALHRAGTAEAGDDFLAALEAEGWTVDQRLTFTSLVGLERVWEHPLITQYNASATTDYQRDLGHRWFTVFVAPACSPAPLLLVTGRVGNTSERWLTPPEEEVN